MIVIPGEKAPIKIWLAEEAEIIKQKRLEKMQKILEEQGYTVNKPVEITGQPSI